MSDTLPLVTDYERERFRALDGQRVQVEATYLKTVVTKRPGGAGEPDLTRPGTVELKLTGGYALMLGIYYGDSGWRPVEEVQRLHGRRVRAVGTLHEATPTQRSPEGYEMQTMINAYLGEVESLEPL